MKLRIPCGKAAKVISGRGVHPVLALPRSQVATWSALVCGSFTAFTVSRQTGSASRSGGEAELRGTGGRHQVNVVTRRFFSGLVLSAVTRFEPAAHPRHGKRSFPPQGIPKQEFGNEGLDEAAYPLRQGRESEFEPQRASRTRRRR